jgi:hypothetical protein
MGQGNNNDVTGDELLGPDEEYFDSQRESCPCRQRREILVVDDNVFNLMTV